ncbi:MAG: glycosyltransferase family 4 protein [Candidatus Omnitrophica bacterium]|nr:glycosyltransferase family 4 protein [Candidatus Omnitrophota bacterium]
MRVCHVITKPELGGAQLSTLNILAGLSADKYGLSIITSPKGVLASEIRDIKGVKSYFVPSLARNINPIADIIAFISIYSIYSANNYAIVHTHSSKAGIIGRWAARFAKVPHIVHTVHGWPFNDHQNPILKGFYIFLERLTAKFTTRIICVSEKDLETGLRHRIAPKDKFVLIKYGIPLAKFRRPPGNSAEKRKELGVHNRDPIVGMISCLKPQKSPVDYIKACIEIYKETPNVNFLLIGDGVLKKRCKEILASTPLNGRFIFAGWRRDISEILDILDIAVLTSKWEGMPISIIEALCKGKPAVITDVGGDRELVRDKVNGFLTCPGSYEDTAKKVLTLLKNKEQLKEMSKRASLSIDDSFDLKNMLNTLDKLYRSLV